ncbi:hypothetical protein [Paenibacillus albiflavus]|uniref:hypothetical protein n=1 Tax=Paenibacillus albiflavus TaxID=2545760 RepID=UPI001F30353E|nr:hypothetical protein [Paenibacillus albiflavus]
MLRWIVKVIILNSCSKRHGFFLFVAKYAMLDSPLNCKVILVKDKENVSVNIGIAFGSALGGFVTTNKEIIDVAWFGGIVAITASLLTFISYSLDRKSRLLSRPVK